MVGLVVVVEAVVRWVFAAVVEPGVVVVGPLVIAAKIFKIAIT